MNVPKALLKAWACHSGIFTIIVRDIVDRTERRSIYGTNLGHKGHKGLKKVS